MALAPGINLISLPHLITRSLLAGTSATNRLFDDVVIFFAASESLAKIKDCTKNCKSKNLATTQGSE